jgi:hypothetical protein
MDLTMLLEKDLEAWYHGRKESNTKSQFGNPTIIMTYRQIGVTSKALLKLWKKRKKIEGSRNRLCEATLQKENLLRSPKLFNLVLRLRKLELAELREVTLFPLLGRTQSFTFPIAQESPQRQSREQTIPLAVTGERGSLKARTCSTAFLSTCLILTENQS